MTVKSKKPASPKKPRAKREPKPKQNYLPIEGIEPPSIPALDDAADTYYEAMQERIGLSKEEDEAKTNLLMKMKEEGLARYETKHGLVVDVLDTSKLKCKKKKDAEEGDEFGGEE